MRTDTVYRFICMAYDSLAWPRPFLAVMISGAGQKAEEGREEEGSGDSEQDAVAQWNVK